MAGPSIVVRVLGDLKGLSSSMDDAGSKAQGAAGRASKAFGGFLSTVNATGVLGPFGGALEGVNNALAATAENGKKLGPIMAGVGAGVATAGAVLSQLGSKEQASQQQLSAAIQATGKSYDDYSGKIDKAVKSQENYGHTADQTKDALRILTQATHDPAEALKLLGQTSDLAAAKHMDLTSAATQVGKVFNGNTKVLKEYGVQAETATLSAKSLAAAQKQAESADTAAATATQKLADLHTLYAGKTTLTAAEQIRLRDATQKVEATTTAAAAAHDKLNKLQASGNTATKAGAANLAKLADVTKNQAAAASDTFGGKLKSLKAKVEDAAAAFGQKYGPALQTVGTAVTALGAIWTVAGPLIAGMELATLWPILLIVAGVAALIAIGYVIYKNWDTIWGAIKDIISGVWNWIKDNWPLLLAILLGPFGIVLDLVIKNFGAIKQAAADVVSFIVGVWNGLYAFFSSLVTTIGAWFASMWNGIYGAAQWVVNLVIGAWNGVINFFRGLPGAIADAARGMWDGIWSAFKSVINLVIGGWNSLDFHIGGGDVFGVKLPEVHLAVPKIHPLAAGGIVTAPTLALIGERGPEAVVPLGQRGGLGPAVVINDAHFSTEADVDLLMRRVAWAARTRAI